MYKRQQYDSVSRFVYAGSAEHSIADFHLKMLEGRVTTILGRVADSTKQLKQAASQLLLAANQTKSGVQQETDELHQVSTAIEEMTQTIQEITRNAIDTSHKVEQAHQDCTSTTNAMNATMKKVEDLANEVAKSADSASELAKEAEKIGGIMQEIQGIADQTNLLALNAAIEAARAGEHGRGFSVVADEVRALSNRTHAATEQIQHSITEIQTTLLNWSKTMEDGKQAAQLCVDETCETQQLVTKVYNTISEISDLTIQISTAAEEQSAVSQEISRNIININDVSANNLAQSERVATESSILELNAEKLASLGLSFKV